MKEAIWNGEVWAPTNYVVIDGLHRYGFHNLAALVTRRSLSNMSTSLQNTGTIWEHYAPESGSVGGVRDFVGWSGIGPIALLIESALGIRVDVAIDTGSHQGTYANLPEAESSGCPHQASSTSANRIRQSHSPCFRENSPRRHVT